MNPVSTEQGGHLTNGRVPGACDKARMHGLPHAHPAPGSSPCVTHDAASDGQPSSSHWRRRCREATTSRSAAPYSGSATLLLIVVAVPDMALHGDHTGNGRAEAGQDLGIGLPVHFSGRCHDPI